MLVLVSVAHAQPQIAIQRKAIDGENLGAQYVVRANPKFERWQPSPKRQRAGRVNQEGST
jgi:hypothetical protein